MKNKEEQGFSLAFESDLRDLTHILVNISKAFTTLANLLSI